MARLIRELRVGSRGDDVYAIKRCVHRYLQTGQLGRLSELPRDPAARRAKQRSQRTYGIFFRVYVKRAQHKLRIDQTGVVTRKMFRLLDAADAPDAYAELLFDQYEREHAEPIIELVEPYQGWHTLHRSLHELYSIGRHAGFLDGPNRASGTHNPDSRLPGGAPSDHALMPALAFDLDIVNKIGWENEKARQYFRTAITRPEVGYAILGTRIWSRRRANEGIRHYDGPPHQDHIHISGIR